jgi:hypothetical protein
MHWLNSHGFAVTQMEGPDVHDRVASAHGHGSPTIPCILLESPRSFTSSIIAQAAVCVHIWSRWRVIAVDLHSAMLMPHLLIAFHFYTPYIEASGGSCHDMFVWFVLTLHLNPRRNRFGLHSKAKNSGRPREVRC